MTTLSEVPDSFAFNENAPTHPPDPFWRSTPRAALDGLAILSQTPPQAAPASQTPSSRVGRSGSQAAVSKKAQCTHTTMNRQYGCNLCHVCGKVPTLGWVYACQQDRFTADKTPLTPSTENLPRVADDVGYFEVQSQVAKSIGMSKSVVAQIRAGEYSFDQIETLLDQRRHVLELIKKSKKDSTACAPPEMRVSAREDRVADESIIASVGAKPGPIVRAVTNSALPMKPEGTPFNTPANSNANTPTGHNTDPAKKSMCHFQVCHACRPFFQDRLYMSFDTALNNEMPAVTKDDATQLQTLNPNVVRNLGLREPPKRAIVPIFDRENMGYIRHGDEDHDDTTEESTPTTQTSSDTNSDVDESGSEPFQCPGPDFCALWSPSRGCPYGQEFHDDDKRAANFGKIPEAGISEYSAAAEFRSRLHRMRGTVDVTRCDTPSSTKSSISLPTPATEPLTPPTPSHESSPLARRDKAQHLVKTDLVRRVGTFDRKRKNVRFHGRRMNASPASSSCLGCDLEVDGGVALTEGAVETGMPDVVPAE